MSAGTMTTTSLATQFCQLSCPMMVGTIVSLTVKPNKRIACRIRPLIATSTCYRCPFVMIQKSTKQWSSGKSKNHRLRQRAAAHDAQSLLSSVEEAEVMGECLSQRSTSYRRGKNQTNAGQTQWSEEGNRQELYVQTDQEMDRSSSALVGINLLCKIYCSHS